MASAAAGAGAGGDLQGLEWAEQTGAATFAVPRDHTDLMRHLQEVLLRGAPEGAMAEDGRSTTCSSFTVLSAADKWGMPRMKKDNNSRRVWEEYATYSNYLCPKCTEGRDVVVRPPFEGMALLRPTDRVSFVPDNRPTAMRLVFTAIQRDKLIACGYELVVDIVPHLPSDRLSQFEEAPAQPVRKRRERTLVQSAAGGTEEDPPEASEQDSSGAGEGGRHTRPKTAPSSGEGVDTLKMPINYTVPDYQTAQELCDQVEVGYFDKDVYITPIYRWPATKDARRKWLQHHGLSSHRQHFDRFNNNYENRLKEYYNILANPGLVFGRMGPAIQQEIGAAEHLVPDHTSFSTVTITKEPLRAAYPDRKTPAIQRVRDLVRDRCARTRRHFMVAFDK